MYCKPVVDFFLGSLSPAGFTGHFEQIAATKGITPYLIKAGPGCGKSTLMRRLAEADARYAAPGQGGPGQLIERLHCSSDPASLDGVLLWDVGVLVLDATAPHTLDCKYPGAAERIISLYHAFDDDKLAQDSTRILALGRRNTALLQLAASTFALACGLLTQRRECAGATIDSEKLNAFALRFAQRHIPARRGAARGVAHHRLLSAPTPEGLTVFYDTVPQLAYNEIYVLQDAYGAAATSFLEVLAEYGAQNGYTTYRCYCPTDQTRIEHLFFPVLGLGFVTSNPWHPMRFSGQKALHMSRFMDAEALRRERAHYSYQRRAATALIERTIGYEKKAKAVHDEMERYYVAAADFGTVDAVRCAVEDKIFG